uniref:MYND-type domain-containing protein n=1 Tax=Xiphophorus maculatus TaxID=8083 RepID=M3ZED6_XIPMA
MNGGLSGIHFSFMFTCTSDELHLYFKSNFRARSSSGGSRVVVFGEERREGFGVQEWPDGSKYEGEFLDDFKHGKGRYSWKNGEFYEGFFYKDLKHGDGEYCWPSGHKFIGKFYLNRKEGYGHLKYPGGAIFQGLYHSDHRFGPGVFSYPDGNQDVGLWIGQRLLKLCSSLEEGFSLLNFPDYAAFMQSSDRDHFFIKVCAVMFLLQNPLQSDVDEDLLSDESFIYPPGIERYSTDGDHLPLPPGRKRELDRVFHGEKWEPEAHPYQGYKRDPLSGDSFGPKGPLEVSSELLIQHSFRGELRAVSQILQKGAVYPDVADARGQTALIAATVNSHNDVIHLLLDSGADIDKMNDERMSALAVCHVLYYPFDSLLSTLIKPPTDTPVRKRIAVLGDMDFWYYWDNNKMTIRTIYYLFFRCSGEDHDLTRNQILDSSCSIRSSDIAESEEMLQQSAELLTLARRPPQCDLQEIIRKMTVEEIEPRVRLTTLMLLLDRGADPNCCRVPLPILFLPIMAGDTEVVHKLLMCGARTDIWFYPLHVAAALHGSEGAQITEMLLHAVTEPDSRACDQEEIYQPDLVHVYFHLLTCPPFNKGDGGRTALHIACQRDEDYSNACKVVELLLSHGARTDLLWSGHSPLSLAIASGNDAAVEEILKAGADPNLPLGWRVGSALCALVNFNYRSGGNRIKMVNSNIEMYLKINANLHLVVISCHKELHCKNTKCYKDVRFAHTPFYALNMQERDLLKKWRQLLALMANLLRESALTQRNLQLTGKCNILFAKPFHTALLKPLDCKSFLRPPLFRFCYHCGRSAFVKLMICGRCQRVYFCSKTCKMKAWDESHKEQCLQMAGGNPQISTKLQ